MLICLCAFHLFRKARISLSSLAFARLDLVEMAVIETASEKSLQGLSTSVSCLLTFPHISADSQAHMLGRQIIHDELSAVAHSRSLLIDASYAAAVLRTETAAYLSSKSNFIVVV